MQVSVTARHIEVTDRIRAYAEEKASRLPRYYDRVQSVEIVLGQEADLSSVEMIVKAPGTRDFIGKEVGPDMVACIDLLLDKMERQLTKHKERFRNRKHLTKKPEPSEEV